MRADYDSEADALSIDLIDAPHWDGAIWIDDDFCHVALAQGVPANIELLSPAENSHLLAAAAEVAGLEAKTLEAAAISALAVPDRVVTIEFSAVAPA